MITPDTQNARITDDGLVGSDPSETRPTNHANDDEFAPMNRLSIPVIICATPAFLVALAGAWAGITELVLAGGSTLGLLQLIWLGAALVTLRKMARNWFIARRIARRQSSVSSAGTGTAQ